MLHLSVFSRTSVNLAFLKKNENAEFNGGHAKIILYLRGDGIEKSVPRDHRLSSFGKPRDAKRLSSRRFFLSHTHTCDVSL